MTVKEFYAKVEGNYDDVLGRLMKEERICKYLFRLSTTGDFEGMHQALDEKNYADAFRFVHNLKGMSLNLGLSALASASSELCETMRNGAPTIDITNLIQEVDDKYKFTVQTIGELQASQS